MNNRLIKLSRDLQVLWMHGEKGQGLAQFYIPHSVAVDSYQRVCVLPALLQMFVFQILFDCETCHMTALMLRSVFLYCVCGSGVGRRPRKQAHPGVQLCDGRLAGVVGQLLQRRRAVLRQVPQTRLQ
ncbi:NHL repeat-containing protein 3 [Anabarilius grahami]|uniref:NHL repeat-containing protein 3 n=1 Tax=Anabarilius grahami TaxID=495550 RepID=A0A3N0XGQ3_ANAGA|nr:NHL repeat-containing protein 3 [Anabarilius grahami]